MDQAIEWKRMTLGLSLFLVVAALGCRAVTGNALTLYQVQSQDVPVLVILGIAASITVLKVPTIRFPARLPSGRMLVLIALALIGALAAGAKVVFDNYPLARDEHMVVFDMAVYASGHLAMPLAPFWRPFAGALVPDFLLNERMPVGLVSTYLPVNALLRLAFSRVANPVLLNPLYVVLGGAALLDIARHAFGRDDRTCWAVLLIYLLSAQMLVNAMTPYSMTAHMALNLVWLAAFLRGGKLGFAVSLVVGFLAVGLHQLVYHPVFVAPFLLWRLREGQWRLVLLYTAAYALIILWWLCYPLLAPVQSASLPTASALGHSQQNFITERLIPLLTHRTPGTIGLMVLNLMRFFSWQNFALVPLLVAAAPLAIRERGLPHALFAGIILWLILLTVVLPYQGLGWGFRYLSPYLGSFALLGGYGYRSLAKQIGNRADAIVIVLSLMTAVLALPLLAVTTHRFAKPYVTLEALIARQRTPFVVIDTAVSNPSDEAWALHPLDQVRNLPDLSNRPLRFSGNRVNSDMIAHLCAMGAVTMITRDDMHRVGFGLNVPAESPRFEQLIRTVDQRKPGCLRRTEVLKNATGAIS